MPDLRLWSALAWRNVWRNRRRSVLTLSIVAVACSAILLAFGFILASFEGLKYSIIYGGAGHFQLAQGAEFADAENKPLEFGLTHERLQALQQQLSSHASTRRILPRLNFQGLISNGEVTRTFSAEGLDPEPEWQAFGKNVDMVAGDYLDGDNPLSIVLGRHLADRLHAKPGDTLTLVSSAVNGQMNAVDVTVKGIVSTGIAARDVYYMAMPLAGAQQLLRTEKVSRVVVLLKDDPDASTLANLERTLPLGVQLRTWQQLNPVYDQLVRLYRGQFWVLGGILLAVAFLAILNTIIMNVMERTREIGSLRALGIDANRIRVLFLLESLFICSGACLLGSALAFGLCALTGQVRIMMPAPPGNTSGYPLQLLWDTPMSLYCSLTLIVLGMLAAWLASRHVSRLNIVDAINTH